MTTMIDCEDRPKKPHPSRYSRHADYILARHEAEKQWRDQRKKDRRRRAILVGAILILAAAFVLSSL